jgi:hypothetical protein
MLSNVRAVHVARVDQVGRRGSMSGEIGAKFTVSTESDGSEHPQQIRLTSLSAWLFELYWESMRVKSPEIATSIEILLKSNRMEHSQNSCAVLILITNLRLARWHVGLQR